MDSGIWILESHFAVHVPRDRDGFEGERVKLAHSYQASC